LRRDISEIIVYLSVLCYTVMFSYFTILKHNSFNTYAWDLGIFDQSLWTTLHSGRLFFSTVELFIVPSGVFFGTHFSPILFLVLPVYYLGSSPQTLLVFQSFILALGAVPLYFFAKNALNNKVVAVAFSSMYLFYPPLQGVNWFDFHLQAFLPLFFFCAFHYLAKEKWYPYLLFIFLSLTVAESVSIIVVFIGLYCFWRFREQIVKAVRTRRLVDKRLIFPILTIIFAAVWMLFVGWIKQTYFPFDPTYTQIYKAVNNWSVLGIQDDPIKLPLYLITQPGRALEALSYDYQLKLLYIALLFAPLLFLSFRSSITAISLAWLVPAVLSNYTPYYLIGAHFPAYPLAFIFLGSVDVLKKDAMPFRLPTLISYTKKLLLVSLLFTLLISPLSPVIATLGNSFPSFADYHLPTMTRHEELLQAIVDIVPGNASILTQNNIFPHFSRRVNAYAYPLSEYNGTELQNYIGDLFKKSEYVMADKLSDNYTASLILSRIQCPKDYGLYAYGDGIYLFKQNYSGETLFLHA
jgi:uncharacterized membrane protein